MVSSNIPTSGEPIVCIREKKAVSLPYVTLVSSSLLSLLSSAAAVVLRMSERTRYGSTGRWSWYDNAYSIMFMYVTAIAVDVILEEAVEVEAAATYGLTPQSLVRAGRDFPAQINISVVLVPRHTTTLNVVL